MAIAIGAAIMIPGLIILLLGISVIIKRSIIEGRFGLIALGIWLLSLGVAGFQLPKVISQFKSEAVHSIDNSISVSDGVMVLKSEQNLREQGILYDLVNLQLVGTD
ncbi:hypothetical protein RZS08_01545, partial [Arthrospira platensis SPKY1]|nr:hypothetical protein [Arthrospira platensis SPKY1]